MSLGFPPEMAAGLKEADVAQAQIILKNNFGTALATLGASKLGRITQNEIFAQAKNLPSVGLQPAANAAIIAQGIGGARYNQALANNWPVAQQQGYSDPLEYQREFTRANPLQKFIDNAKAEMGPLKGMKGAGTQAPVTVGTTAKHADGSRVQWNGSAWVPVQ
jgi:hypothetical protein